VSERVCHLSVMYSYVQQLLSDLM